MSKSSKYVDIDQHHKDYQCLSVDGYHEGVYIALITFVAACNIRYMGIAPRRIFIITIGYVQTLLWHVDCLHNMDSLTH